MKRADLIDATTRHGIATDQAERAVDAVMAALRTSPLGVMVFREVDGRSVPADKRKTIFMCG